ncbi:hypothetical protein CFOL_v3_21916, partial [Cephalotus follicularis]
DSLPVKYLGLPLITKRLSKQECSVLTERVMKRDNCWIRPLSFAGRLQLIKSTLLNMHIYWSSIFLIPSSIIKDYESVTRNFLWGGSEQHRKAGKVKWSTVCKTLREGGLGIRDMRTWNKALLLNQIWKLLNGKSLWATWCRKYLIRKSNFWILPTLGPYSWSWTQILKYKTCR